MVTVTPNFGPHFVQVSKGGKGCIRPWSIFKYLTDNNNNNEFKYSMANITVSKKILKWAMNWISYRHLKLWCKGGTSFPQIFLKSNNNYSYPFSLFFLLFLSSFYLTHQHWIRHFLSFRSLKHLNVVRRLEKLINCYLNSKQVLKVRKYITGTVEEVRNSFYVGLLTK